MPLSDIIMAKKLFGDSTGGTGGGVSIIEEKDVNFYDYDGTLIASYTIEEANNLTALPTAPNHTENAVPLTFQNWTDTLARINATTTPIDIGAMYITTDGKTHLKTELTNTTGLTQTLYFTKSATFTLLVEWGDGATSTNSASGTINMAHTYANVGEYEVKISISSGSGTYTFGNGTAITAITGPSNSSGLSLIECYIGSNVASIGDYAFYQRYNLKTITLPYGITNIGNNVLSTLPNIEFVIVPNGTITIGDYAFYNLWKLTLLILPQGITSIGEQALSGVGSLRRLIIPLSVVSLGDYAMKTTRALEVLYLGNLTNLGTNVLYASQFKSLTIPASVSSIGTTALAGCYSCLEYHFLRTTPPTLVNSNAFTEINPLCKIYVPAASVSAYKAATNWATYANYIVGE